MSEPKRKPENSLRLPKPKKLGLSVPRIRDPHDVLIPPSPSTALLEAALESATPDNLTEVVNLTEVKLSAEVDFVQPPPTLTPAVNLTTADNLTEVVKIIAHKGMTKFPNTILDGLLPLLDPAASLIYLRLYRLSHGFRSNTCTVGTARLAASVNMSEKTVERMIPKLENLGLLQRLGANFGKGVKGNIYRINLPATSDNLPEVDKLSEVDNLTGDVKLSLINHDHDDHDDFKENRRQSAQPVENPAAEDDEERRKIKQEFERLTGKRWSRYDEAALDQLKGVSPARVLDFLPAIHARAKNPIGNFAFFATSILREVTTTLAVQPRNHLRRRYEALAAEIASVNLGRDDLRPSDWVAALKTRCAREGLQWDDDLANEILSL